MDFSKLFQATSSDAPAPLGGLTALFSDDNKQKFSRSFKQTEFVPLEKEKVEESDSEPEMDEKLKAKREKRKLRNMKRNGGKDGDVTTNPETTTEVTKEENATADAVPAEATIGVELSTDVKVGDSAERDERTLFVGNIPKTYNAEKLSKLFSKYGIIDAIRLRSVPFAGAKIDKAGDHDLMRKVCVNSGKLGTQKGSVNAYIVYKEKESITAALELNNTLLGDRHLRVDIVNPSLFDPKRSVFVGGLPYYADEEEVREYFATVLTGKQDDIEGIRLVRDNETLVGKGIGFLLFKTRDCVMKALTLHEKPYKKRWVLRVTVCGKRTKRTNDSKKEGNSESQEGGGEKKRKAADSEDHKNDTAANNSNNNNNSNEDESKNKKPRKDEMAELSANVVNAMKRIRKTVMTKKKLLKTREQKGGRKNTGNSNSNSSSSSNKKSQSSSKKSFTKKPKK